MADDTLKTVGRIRKASPADSERLNALIVSTKSADRIPAEEPALEEGSGESHGDLETFVEVNTEILDALAAMHTEMLTFGSKRLSANIEHSESLAGCEHLEQAIRIQSEFFESAVQQYLDQASRVTEIMASMTWSLWWPPGGRPEMETRQGLNEISQRGAG